MHDGITNLERADLAAHSIPLSRFAPGRRLEMPPNPTPSKDYPEWECIATKDIDVS
jgi:hypothetical protein